MAGLSKENRLKEKESLAFFCGGVLAGILFLCIYGFRILDVTYDDWLFFGLNRKDLVQHYMGWVNFRKSPWHFPIGLMDGVIYPDLVSVVYTDSVPLFAIPFKLLSPLLPETFQYFGWFGLLCAVLLGGWSAKFLCHRTVAVGYSVIASVFFSLSVFFLKRTFWHTALAAQWLILVALYLWLCRGEETDEKKNLRGWSTLSVIALLTEAYFLPMVWGIFVCTCLTGVGKEKEKKRRLAVLKDDGAVALVAAGVTIIVAALLGVFYGKVSVSDSLLGLVSFNGNAFVNPMEYSSYFPGLPLYNSGQYEGYAYLGLGMYVLLALAVAVWLVRLKKGTASGGGNALPYLVFFLGFIGFASSPILSVGVHAIALPLPALVYRLWSIFRSTGRLIWPVCFFLMLFACEGVYRLTEGEGRLWHRKGLAYGILVAALCLQIGEESGYIGALHQHYTDDYVYESKLTGPAWEEIAEKYDHIMVYPPTIVVNLTPLADELMIYASHHRMTMNAVYLARDITALLDEREMAYFDSGAYLADEDTVYVFFAFVEPQDDYDLYYYELQEDIVIGVKEPLSAPGLKVAY